ncbi:MAG: hypothetical protein JF609_05095 [Verrucomicrobia bacterium]|nr:hypothetical protein [Verrucomicrobiota bacterium]
MHKAFRRYSGLVLLSLTTGLVQAATNSASGLWVGEVVLQRVNETVSGVNAANQVVSPDPSVPTPVNAPAHIRIIFHVDSTGKVRLLKGVAMVDKSTNTTPNIALISDPSLYQQFGGRTGQRITAATFDFGDGPGAQNALDQIATAAGTAAAAGGNVLAAANAVVNSYQTNIPPGSTAAYTSFIQSATFSSAASMAATSASQSLMGVSGSQNQKTQIAILAAANTLKDANVYTAADALTLNEVLMTGQFAPANNLTGTIYLGADHPTNPFRHQWNPIHRHGYAVTRALSISFDSASSTNAIGQPGFGVDHITGSYHESVSGLHKPLGPNQDIGLIAEGTIKLDRVSLVGTLNQ